MSTVAYFAKRHTKCISRLHLNALNAAIFTIEKATWVIPMQARSHARQVRDFAQYGRLPSQYTFPLEGVHRIARLRKRADDHPPTRTTQTGIVRGRR